MILRTGFLWMLAVLVMQPAMRAQSGALQLPKTVRAGSAFSIRSDGSGKGTLYIAGLGQSLKRDVQLGEDIQIPAGTLYDAGRYLVAVTGGSSTQQGMLDVLPAAKPDKLSFFAKPSRLPVSLAAGISGTVYVFDAYHNLITTSTPVDFELSNAAGVQRRSLTTQNGVAWTLMDSTAKEGNDSFVARVGDLSSTRIIQQVPGDPCSIQMSAQQQGPYLTVTTQPVRDCSGNAVPDGTIVTFTESYNGTQSTVDVPLKRGIAQVKMPAQPGATLSVASGVVLGNEIHWR